MNNYIILFDTETTGLVKPSPSPLAQQPHIIEFAAMKVTDDENMESVECIEFKCKPPNPLSADIKAYHKKAGLTGLGEEDLAECKSFPEYYNDLVNFFWGSKTMLAHNVAFDRSLLKFELMRMNKVLQFPWPINHICTVDETYSIKGYRLSLVKLYKHLFNEELEQKHRAMDDVVQLLKVSRELRKLGLI